MEPLHLSPEVLASVDGKVVPLVMYDNAGKRRVVGEATLHADGKGLRIDSKIEDPEMKKLIEGFTEGLSISKIEESGTDG